MNMFIYQNRFDIRCIKSKLNVYTIDYLSNAN